MGSDISTTTIPEKVDLSTPIKRDSELLWGGAGSIIDYFSRWNVPLLMNLVNINIVIYDDIYTDNERSEALLYLNDDGATKGVSLTSEEIKKVYIEPEMFEDAEVVYENQEKDILSSIKRIELELLSKFQKSQSY